MKGEGWGIRPAGNFARVLDSLKCHTSSPHNPLMGWRLMTFQPKFSNGITREVVSLACCDEVYV